jgi:fatty acyl-ACP thioesterase A
MRKLHLIWVTARMHIEIYKYPAWYFFLFCLYYNFGFEFLHDEFILIHMGVWNRSDVVEIETWCQGDGRIGTRRDWIIKDCATGQVIGRATR